jgi:hypothetical protein
MHIMIGPFTGWIEPGRMLVQDFSGAAKPARVWDTASLAEPWTSS